MASLPPGPRQPSFVQILRWAFRPLEFLTDCERRFGDTFTVRFPRYPPIVLTSDPAAVARVFAGDPAELHSGAANRMMLPLLGPASLILLDGAAHTRHRRLLMPPFRGHRMRAYGPAILEIADAEIDGWTAGDSLALLEAMQRIALNVILRVVIGVVEPGRVDRLRRAVLRLIAFTANPGTLMMVNQHGEVRGAGLQDTLGRFSPWGRFRQLRDDVDRLLYDEFARRRQGPRTPREDVLSLLLETRDEDGRPMTDAELRDELLTMLVAGHETTATALAWVAYRILDDPAIAQRVESELAARCGRESVAPDSVAGLRYLDATIKETHRLHPVLPFVVRQLTRPLELGGRRLPAGAIVAPNIWLTHRRADLWDRPESFRPERFLDGLPRGNRYFPFGGGTRSCIGMAFASYEMTLVLARLLQRRRFRLQPGYRPRTVRRGIVFAPSGGVPVIVDHGG